MRRLGFLAASLAAFSAQATAQVTDLSQVRPDDCRPVFPVMDETAQIIPPDVITEQAPPAVVAQRRFIGLPFLIPLLFAGGLILIITDHDHHHDTVSPA